MLESQKKLQENIAEYVLYMFQVEDLIRAYNFDVNQIIANYVRPSLSDINQIEEYKRWYQELILQMKAQKIENQGHLHELKDILVELSYLHNTLIGIANDKKYQGVYEHALPFITEFIERSNLKNKNHIEVIFHAMYMKLLLRLQRKEISSETEEAFDAMRVVLAYLAMSYKQMKMGELNFLNN